MQQDVVLIGSDWEGRLDEWLSAIALTDDARNSNVQYYSFPTDNLKREYLATIKNRSADQVQQLLKSFLFGPGIFGSDIESLKTFLNSTREDQQRALQHPYIRNIVERFRRREVVNPGIDWVLQLLPERPAEAIQVIDTYFSVFAAYLPDGRIEGLSDATEIIEAYYLEPPQVDSESVEVRDGVLWLGTGRAQRPVPNTLIERELPSGGNSRTYKGTHQYLSDRHVVVKVWLSRNPKDERNKVQQGLKEANKQEAAVGRHTARLYDVGELSG